MQFPKINIRISKNTLIYGGFFLLIVVFFGANVVVYAMKQKKSAPVVTASPSPSIIAQASPTSTPKGSTEPSPSQSPSPSPKTSPSPTPKTSPTPKATPTPTPSASPVAAPEMIINVPKEGQVIEFTSNDQQFCVNDSVYGGNTTDLQEKHNINESGWTQYVAHTTSLCYTPKEGNNTLQMQYKNGAGKESGVYTVHFTFVRSLKYNAVLSGTAFEDENCNGTKDQNEKTLSVSGNINIMRGTSPYAMTTINGSTYTYSFQLNRGESVMLKPYFQGSLDGYVVSVSKEVTITEQSSTQTSDIPLIKSNCLNR